MKMMHIPVILAALLFFIPLAHAVQYNWYDGKGVAHSLKEFSGEPVILHFWASWCGPCRKELPELAAWRAQHPEVPFVAISLDQNMSDARNYLDQQRLPFPLLVGSMNDAMQLGIRGLPTTLVIDQTGKIIQRLLGSQPWENAEFSREILTAMEPWKVRLRKPSAFLYQGR